MLLQTLPCVTRDPKVERLGCRPTDQGVEGVGVRAGDLRPGQNLPLLIEIDDLVARSHEGNPRRAVHQRLIDGDRRQDAELRGPERRARGENDRSSFDVLTAAPDVLLYIARIADRDRSIRSTPLS